MNKIIYSTGNYYLTQSEFESALLCWDKKSNYYCKRTGELLSPFNRTEKLDESCVYYKLKSGKYLEVLKNGNNYLKPNYKTNNSTRISFKNDEQRKEFESELLNEDEFIDGVFEGKNYKLAE